MPKIHPRQATVNNCCAGLILKRPAEVEKGFNALKTYVAGNTEAPSRSLAQEAYEYILGLEVFIAGAYRVVSRPADKEEAEQQPEPVIPLIVFP